MMKIDKNNEAVIWFWLFNFAAVVSIAIGIILVISFLVLLNTLHWPICLIGVIFGAALTIAGATFGVCILKWEQ
jgi:hypothetical protein